MSTMLALGLRGPSSCKKREGLGLWYDGYRESKPPEG